MKIILVSLLITILAMQESKARTFSKKLLEENSESHDGEREAQNETALTRKTRELTEFKRIGSKFYHFEHTEEVNWFEAVHKCREMGGYLANLQSEEEFEAVTGELFNKNYWLDISDLANNGEYKSLKTGRKAGYFHWHTYEPNNYGGSEHCVNLKTVNGEYGMNDDQCRLQLNFICEIDQ